MVPEQSRMEPISAPEVGSMVIPNAAETIQTESQHLPLDFRAAHRNESELLDRIQQRREAMNLWFDDEMIESAIEEGR